MAKQMTLDQDYIDSYSKDFSKRICDNHFTNKKRISGQEIIELSASTQLNLMVIRELFEDWQKQVDSFTQNPYFDYSDSMVKEALASFMNVLSRAISIEKSDFEPLLTKAVAKTLHLAIEPVSFMERTLEELTKDPASQIKELKKYIKWHRAAWEPAADDLAADPGNLFWKQKLYEGFEKEVDESMQPVVLLDPFQEILPLDFKRLVTEVPETIVAQVEPEVIEEEKVVSSHYIIEEETKEEIQGNDSSKKEGIETIDPAIVWAKFDTEENPYMKGSIAQLKEGMGINQRIMFTKRLFQGNPDLMEQAIIELDETESFYEAIDLLNHSFVKSLNWDVHSDEVMELLQLIFRKYDSE
ncbi:MAG: hypothetical protein GYB55_17510 [Cytophagales bacterium]|uniref:hypothetical protein n=1 Tax=Cyclobacterium marinum TaxID=104 RepID=UPI0030DA3BEE|nr:hypothetical protein [Cytophagales bacterium]|tara:strand:+ start:43387 stop:44454 length:1068 start_codon:yes stop_codon:yes gene_type:complete